MRRRLSVWLCALTLLCCAGVAPAGAQETESIDDSRATAFRAVEGPQAEQVPGGSLMVGAYMVLITLLVGYVVRLGRLQRRTHEEVERLSSLLAEHEAQD